MLRVTRPVWGLEVILKVPLWLLRGADLHQNPSWRSVWSHLQNLWLRLQPRLLLWDLHSCEASGFNGGAIGRGAFLWGLSAVLGGLLQHSRPFQALMNTSHSSRITTSLLL